MYPTGHYNVTFTVEGKLYSAANQDKDFKPIYRNGQKVPCFYGPSTNPKDTTPDIFLKQYPKSPFSNFYWIGVLGTTLIPCSIGFICFSIVVFWLFYLYIVDGLDFFMCCLDPIESFEKLKIGKKYKEMNENKDEIYF